MAPVPPFSVRTSNFTELLSSCRKQLKIFVCLFLFIRRAWEFVCSFLSANLWAFEIEHFVDGLSGNRVPHTRSEITVHCHRDTSNSSCTWLFVSVEFQIPHGDSSWRSFSVILAILMFDSAVKMFGEVKCLSLSGSKVLTYRRPHALVLVIVSY